MSTVLGVDPGPTESAYALISQGTRRPLEFAKIPNAALRDGLRFHALGAHHTAIEMVASYGMPVGAEVFETCVWIGRFLETLHERTVIVPRLVYRRDVKLHHCHSARASDANIAQALKDRFTPGQPNHGKGTKAVPGWFYGFKADLWQAYALAVYVADALDSDVTARPLVATGEVGRG